MTFYWWQMMTNISNLSTMNFVYNISDVTSVTYIDVAVSMGHIQFQKNYENFLGCIQMKLWNFAHVTISSTWKLGVNRTHHQNWNPNWQPFCMISKRYFLGWTNYFWNSILEKHYCCSKTCRRFYWWKAITTACWQTKEWDR